jgi:hypothetical protein
MRRLLALPFVVLAIGPAATTEPQMPAHVVAEMFCMARTVGDMSLIDEYLTSALYTAIGDALLRNSQIQEQAPDEKPPLGDGVPWASYQDAVPSCVVDYVAAEATPTAIPVTYAFPDAPEAGWTDTLVLVSVEGEWQLDDLLYETGGRLTEVLVTAFEP